VLDALVKPRRTVKNRFALPGARAVPAAVLHIKLEVNVVLLAGLQSQQSALAFLDDKIAGIRVDAILCVNELAMVLEQPLDAVRFAAFFVGGKGKDQVARRDPAFALEANKAREQQRVTVFYVAGAAPVEVASGFGELEGIEVRRPILLERLHHVEVTEEENWFSVLIPSAQTHHQIVLVG